MASAKLSVYNTYYCIFISSEFIIDKEFLKPYHEFFSQERN